MTYRDEVRVLEELTEEDRVELKSMLTTSVMKRLMGQMVREVEGKRTQIGAHSLLSEEDIRKAVQLQGEIAGQARTIDLILEGTGLE